MKSAFSTFLRVRLTNHINVDLTYINVDLTYAKVVLTYVDVVLTYVILLTPNLAGANRPNP